MTIICFFKPAWGAPATKVILTTHNLPHYGAFPSHSQIKSLADESFKGEAIATMRCVFNQLTDYEMEVLVVPWKRAQHLVRRGYADGFFAASQNPERDSYAQISQTIAAQEWRWYFLKDSELSPQDKGFKAKANVGSFIGANMLTWLEKNNYKIAVKSIKTQDLLHALKIGRLDAILANNKVIDSLLAQSNMKLEIKSVLHSNRPLGAYFSNYFLQQHPNFLALFNNGVTLCRSGQSTNAIPAF